jgi:hypothetical protein
LGWREGRWDRRWGGRGEGRE